MEEFIADSGARCFSSVVAKQSQINSPPLAYLVTVGMVHLGCVWFMPKVPLCIMDKGHCSKSHSGATLQNKDVL